MYGIEPDLNADYILSNVSQEAIFEHYLGISVEFGSFFCSPLRSDKNPTCNFKYVGSYLLFRDWAESKPKNCFEIVKEVKQCNYIQALQDIKDNLIDSNNEVLIPKKVINNSKKNKSKIRVNINSVFQDEVKEYLKSFKLTKKQLSKFKVFPIKSVFLNDKLHYIYSKYDPAIAYYFGNEPDQRWKIYFFKREQYRFLTNTNRINGWIQLPKTDSHLVITKSLKDVMCLDVFNIPAIAMQNETTVPYDYIIEELSSRFDTLVSLYDYDRTGIINANKLKRLYNIPYLFFKDIPNVKDFSDYLKVYGIDNTQKLINSCYKEL